jgi:tetratricopeptide (TPR) repeat protein
VQTAEVQRAVKRETYVVQNGVRNETVNETGADGKVHAVTYAYPITQEVWRDHVTRTFVFHAEARLVNTRDASVLWQESSDWSGESKAQEEANGQRTGDWSTDEEFRNRQLHQAAQHLLAKLLPRMLTRNRQLAECAQEGPYAEWISTGNQAAVAGRWEQAGESWLKAVSLSPGRPEALANLGVFYEHQGDYNQALQDYKLAARQLKKNWGDYAREVEKFLEKH